MAMEMAGLREKEKDRKRREEVDRIGACSELARFMSAFYAPLNYLVNGTMGAPSFLFACMAFPRDLLTPLYPTGSFFKPIVPVNGEKLQRRRGEKEEKDGTVGPNEREIEEFQQIAFADRNRRRI